MVEISSFLIVTGLRARIAEELLSVGSIWDSNAKKPVMVWFHGGGFYNGSSIEGVAYDGKNLSDFGDVVVVTVNHRLNALGYMDLSDYGGYHQYSGNCGTADLVASLKWVKENIANFWRRSSTT